MSVHTMPAPEVIRLDASGLPHGHVSAQAKAVEVLRDLVNELPESAYHLGPTDAEWIIDNVLRVYLHTLRRTR